MEEDIVSHEDADFVFDQNIIMDKLLLEDDVYCKTFYVFLKSSNP